jgi:glucan phosphoethanolaminetransferase (alkaline phosphatase superfamily)
MPLESSVSALKVSEVPTLLLNFAVMLFLFGFGLYLLFSWLRHVEMSGLAYRNIFIVFIVTTGVFCVYYFIWDIIRILDAKNRSQEFNLAPPEDFQKSKVQQDVEKKLLALQELQQLSWNSSVDEQKAKECLGVLRGRLVDSAEMV